MPSHNLNHSGGVPILTVDQFVGKNTSGEAASSYMDEVQRLTCRFKPQMEKFIKDEISLPSWEPAFDLPSLKVPQKHRQFIHDLKIPRARAPHDHLPDMLLHNLGRFQQDEQLKARIQGLFTTHPTHKIFVNTSGAGKTRAVLEHLCSNWGLYFSCHDDSHVGSKDVPSAMSNIRKTLNQSTLPHAPNLLVTPADIAAHSRDKDVHPSDVTEEDVLRSRIANFKKDVPKSDKFSQALEKNQQLAGSSLLVPLLARLLILQQYIATVQSVVGDLSQMDHKRRWLHLQLHPHLLSSNGQDDLFHQLGRDLDNYFKKENFDLSQKIDTIRSLSHEILQSVREALGLNPRKRKPIPLYVVIDECQFAVTDMENHYRSSQWTAKRGILREMARWWDEVLNRSADGRLLNALIFTGTGLSREIISDVLSSVVMKPEYCTSVYDTGAFDDPEAQAAYLESFFPLDTWKTSERLRSRMYYWLKGRYRFTAEYLSLVLQCGYQNMHQLLDQYIHSVAGFHPADFESPEKSFFGMVELPAPAFGFEKLDERMREKVKTIAHEYLFTSKLETYLGTDERSYIELGLARISGYDGQKSVKIDEPLVLLSCSVWFNEQRPHTVYKTLADHIQKHDPTTGRNGFEEFIAFYLLKVFEKPRKLNHVFDFEGAADNGLGDREARLVTLHVDESGRKPKVVEGEVSLSKGASSLFGPIGLAIGSDDHSVLNEWMNLRRHATFCFPMNLMGPDIMCFLKLKGKRSRKFTYVCLAIQCKFFRAETLRPCTLRGAIATVTPGKFFEGDPSSDHAMNRKRILNALQNLKSKDSAAGKYGIVRVICGFPVHVNLGKAFPIAVNTKSGNKRQRVITKDPDQDDDHPLGKLRTSLLISTTGNEHPTDILEVIRQSALNAKRKGLSFLDEQDPAVLGIDQYQNSDPNNKTIDSIESEIAQLVIHPGSKRKR